MFRLYSNFWLACRFLLPFCIIHLQKSMNVSAKITLLAGLAPSPSLGGVWPSNKCLLVSKRHVFYELFEAPLRVRENYVSYVLCEPLLGFRGYQVFLLAFRAFAGLSRRPRTSSCSFINLGVAGGTVLGQVLSFPSRQIAERSPPGSAIPSAGIRPGPVAHF